MHIAAYSHLASTWVWVYIADDRVCVLEPGRLLWSTTLDAQPGRLQFTECGVERGFADHRSQCFAVHPALLFVILTAFPPPDVPCRAEHRRDHEVCDVACVEGSVVGDFLTRSRSSVLPCFAIKVCVLNETETPAPGCHVALSVVVSSRLAACRLEARGLAREHLCDQHVSDLCLSRHLCRFECRPVRFVDQRSI